MFWETFPIFISSLYRNTAEKPSIRRWKEGMLTVNHSELPSSFLHSSSTKSIYTEGLVGSWSSYDTNGCAEERHTHPLLHLQKTAEIEQTRQTLEENEKVFELN